MAIIRWKNGDPDTGEPFNILKDASAYEGFEINSIDEQKSSLFGEMQSTQLPGKEGMPDVEVTQDEDNVYLACELPFVDESSLKVKLNQDVLRIAGEVRIPGVGEEDRAGTMRQAFGMALSLRLIRNIDKKNIKAIFRNGKLNIVLPKKQEFQA